MFESHDTWFSVTEVASKTWHISDNGFDNIYLVEGEERALLVDTGCGVGDLKTLVSTLTSLPITVVNTHGHPDHVLGNAQFPEAHIAGEDALRLGRYTSIASRQMILQGMLSGKCSAGFSADEWLASEIGKIIPVENGHEFELGERCIKVVAMPGHSAGCIGLLDEKEKLFFSGDSIAECDLWLHYQDSMPLSVYLQSLKAVSLLRDRFDHILPGHHTTPIRAEIVDELMQGVSSIVDGRLKGVPHTTFMGDGLICRFGKCSVVYNPAKL